MGSNADDKLMNGDLTDVFLSEMDTKRSPKSSQGVGEELKPQRTHLGKRKAESREKESSVNDEEEKASSLDDSFLIFPLLSEVFDGRLPEYHSNKNTDQAVLAFALNLANKNKRKPGKELHVIPH